jgi:hypothetical protein
VLVAMAVDRLTRSVVDQAPIADAFFVGEVLLVTQDGKTLFDKNLDVTPWQMKALIAEWERDRYSFRRKIHNEERASRGQRSCGYAPYGYRWVRPALSEDGQTILKPGHYEIVESEYAVVEEIFRRIQTEGISSIARELNVRCQATGYPLPPSHERRLENKAALWNASTLYRILTNPHYCGFPAHRTAMQRGKGRTRLPLSEWVFASCEQDYPHPLSGLDAWYELRALLESRRAQLGGNVTQGTLTGILKCPHGQAMRCGGSGLYTCSCRQHGHEHPGAFITASRAEAVALKVLQEAFAALLTEALPSMTLGPDRKTLNKQRVAALQERAAQEHLANELMKNASLIVSLYGEQDFREKGEANKRALDAARKRVEELEALLSQPDIAEKRALLERIASLGDGDVRLGTQRLWEAADFSRRREMLRYVLAQMRLRTPKTRRRQCREIEVVLQPFYASYYTPPVFNVTELCPHYRTVRMLRGEGRNRHICSHCGAVVYRQLGRDKSRLVFCNRVCYKTWRNNRAAGPKFVTLNCSFCHKAFQRQAAEAKRKAHHFCSRDCYRAYKTGTPLPFSRRKRAEPEDMCGPEEPQ